MTIFKDISELKNCVLELEEYFSNAEYIELLSFIDNAKLYDITDEHKQQLCNIQIKRILVKKGIIKGYHITEWLEEQRDKYRDLVAYVEQEAKWKKNTD